jgi:Xaa-Pro aminopeptidase
MNRLDEINAKHDLLRALLAEHKADALWLQTTRNVAWITAGADCSIPVDSDSGVYSVLVTPEKRVIYTNNIEITRLRAEEDFESLGFAYHEFAWHAPQQPSVAHLISDSIAVVETQIQRLRLALMPGEQERYRALGRDAAAALDEAIRAVRPGDTEFEIAARLDTACRKRGGLAVVNLVATDERISQFRHPVATSKKLDKYAMIVVCMRRGGLIVAGTRLAYVGTLPGEIAEKARKVAAVDAAAIAATRPGRTLGAVLADIQAAYAAQGEDGQWQYHHQGGPTGYNSREWLVTPGDERLVQANGAYAWNPSIVGCKSEDTFLVSDSGFEIISAAPAGWPLIEVEINGQVIPRPGIIEL